MDSRYAKSRMTRLFDSSIKIFRYIGDCSPKIIRGIILGECNTQILIPPGEGALPVIDGWVVQEQVTKR